MLIEENYGDNMTKLDPKTMIQTLCHALGGRVQISSHSYPELDEEVVCMLRPTPIHISMITYNLVTKSVAIEIENPPVKLAVLNIDNIVVRTNSENHLDILNGIVKIYDITVTQISFRKSQKGTWLNFII